MSTKARKRVNAAMRNGHVPTNVVRRPKPQPSRYDWAGDPLALDILPLALVAARAKVRVVR